MLTWLWDVISPKRCLECGKEGNYFCERCVGDLQVIDQICPVCANRATGGVVHKGCKSKWEMSGLVAVFGFGGVIRRALSRIKYRFVYAIVYDLAQVSVNFVTQNSPIYLDFMQFLDKKTIVTFIPSYWARKRRRGFNQAEELARELAKIWGTPCKDLLTKTRNIEQVGLSRKERIGNVIGAFSLKDVGKLSEKIVVVDDVWTTGATMRECIRVLRKGGAKTVWGFTIAR